MATERAIHPCSVAILAVLQIISAEYAIPSGAILHVRLAHAISSQTAHRDDGISATLIAPVKSGDRVLAAGATLRGTVSDLTAYSLDHQARLRLDFYEIQAGPATERVATKLVAVDNARESLEPDGVISGPATQADRAFGRAELLAMAALVPEIFVLDVAGSRIRAGARLDISYPAGVDLDLELTRPLALRTDSLQLPAPAAPIPDSLVQKIRAVPIRTAAGRPPHPADVINIVFLGSRARLEDAFARAGWSTAVALSARADVKTFLAVAKHEGYRSGPVSLQTLDDRNPDLVFQKQTNTFAKRHHVRIWRRGSWNSRPLWVAAASHDIGVEFAAAERTFTHRVDGQIDLERDKIADDLAFVGVPAPTVVDRPSAPRHLVNAAGDALVTDGRVDVIDVGDR